MKLTRRTECRTANSTYPKVAVQWLNQALCFYQSLCLVESESLRNRQLLVAPKRYSDIRKYCFDVAWLLHWGEANKLVVWGTGKRKAVFGYKFIGGFVKCRSKSQHKEASNFALAASFVCDPFIRIGNWFKIHSGVVGTCEFKNDRNIHTCKHKKFTKNKITFWWFIEKILYICKKIKTGAIRAYTFDFGCIRTVFPFL